MDDWRSWPDFTPKDLKFLDRQTALLYLTTHDLLANCPDLDRARSAVHAAVGPARTDPDAMYRWAARIPPDSAEPVTQAQSLPMIQPAGAIGLLPNTPLSWLSIKLGLTGDCGVWAGFEDAGFAALSAARDAISCEAASQALVAAVSSPDNYFVLDGFKRGFHSPICAPVEIGVALHLRCTNSASGDVSPRINALAAFPSGTSVETVLDIITKQSLCDLHENSASQKTLLLTPLNPQNAIIDGIDGRADLSGRIGASMPAALPLAISFAGQCVFGKNPVAIIIAAPFGSIYAAVVTPAPLLSVDPKSWPAPLSMVSEVTSANASCSGNKQ
ncbi:MAG: hypothetical protein HQM09_12915 [Candidatus Riflebacteria bacterium]|nr:hypothetical protein [Candidatus Riflebacteria bacterium]